MKKLSMFWLFAGKRTKMGQQVCREISAYLISWYTFVSVEFQRKPRHLVCVCKYKSNDYRELLMYIGPVVFKLLHDKVYSNFLTFHVAARLLSSPDSCQTYNEYAGELMKNLVSNFKLIYGEECVSYLIHGCLHVHLDVQVHGPLEEYSVYRYENFLQKLKSLVRKGEKPLQ